MFKYCKIEANYLKSIPLIKVSVLSKNQMYIKNN